MSPPPSARSLAMATLLSSLVLNDHNPELLDFSGVHSFCNFSRHTDLLSPFCAVTKKHQEISLHRKTRLRHGEALPRAAWSVPALLGKGGAGPAPPSRCKYVFLIEVYLIYKVVLVPGGQQSDSVICIFFFFRFLSVIDYYKILSTVPWDIQ